MTKHTSSITEYDSLSPGTKQLNIIYQLVFLYCLIFALESFGGMFEFSVTGDTLTDVLIYARNIGDLIVHTLLARFCLKELK